MRIGEPCTTGQNSLIVGHQNHAFPRARERVSERASERVSAAERASEASGASERANGQASGPVLTSRFLAFLTHRGTAPSGNIGMIDEREKDPIFGPSLLGGDRGQR